MAVPVLMAVVSVNAFAGAAIGFLEKGMLGGSTANPFKLPEIPVPAGLSTHSFDVDPRVIAFTFAEDKPQLELVTYSMAELDSNDHALVFFQKKLESEPLDSASTLVFTGENSVLTGAGAQCETTETGPVCTAEAGVPVIVQFTSPSEHWMKEITLRVNGEWLSLCELQKADLQIGFVVLLIEGESDEPSPVPGCLSDVSPVKNTVLPLLQGRLELDLTMADGDTGRLLAMVYQPRQLPPPENDTGNNKESGTTENKQPASTAEGRAESKGDKPPNSSSTSSSSSGGGDDHPWRTLAELKVFSDWQKLLRLLEEEQEIADEEQEIQNTLLTLEDNQEMTEGEKSSRRRALYQRLRKLGQRRSHIRSTVQMEYDQLIEAAVDREAQVEEYRPTRSASELKALERFQAEVLSELQESEELLAFLNHQVLAATFGAQRHERELAELQGQISKLKAKQKTGQKPKKASAKTNTHLPVPAGSGRASPASSQASSEDLESVLDLTESPPLQQYEDQRMYVPQFSRDSCVPETPCLSRRDSLTCSSRNSEGSPERSETPIAPVCPTPSAAGITSGGASAGVSQSSELDDLMELLMSSVQKGSMDDQRSLMPGKK